MSEWNSIIRASLRRYMADTGVAMTTWSTNALGSPTTLRKLLKDENRDIQISTIERLAKNQGMSVIDLMLYSYPSTVDVLLQRLKAASFQRGEDEPMNSDQVIVQLLQQIINMLGRQEQRTKFMEDAPRIDLPTSDRDQEDDTKNRDSSPKTEH